MIEWVTHKMIAGSSGISPLNNTADRFRWSATALHELLAPRPRYRILDLEFVQDAAHGKNQHGLIWILKVLIFRAKRVLQEDIKFNILF